MSRGPADVGLVAVRASSKCRASGASVSRGYRSAVFARFVLGRFVAVGCGCGAHVRGVGCPAPGAPLATAGTERRDRGWNPRPARRFRPYIRPPRPGRRCGDWCSRKACARYACILFARVGMSYDRIDKGYYRVNSETESPTLCRDDRPPRTAFGNRDPLAPRPPAPGGSGGRPAPVLRTGTMPHPCA